MIRLAPTHQLRLVILTANVLLAGQYVRVLLETLCVDIAMLVHTHVKQVILVMTTLRRVSMERACLMNVVPTLHQHLAVMLGRCVQL